MSTKTIYTALPDRLAHLKSRLSDDPWNRDIYSSGKVHLLLDDDKGGKSSKGNKLDVKQVVSKTPNSIFSLGGMGFTP